MNKVNCKLIQEKIDDAVTKLVQSTSQSPENIEAYICQMIISMSGSPYYELPDDYTQTVEQIINMCKKNPRL